MFVHLKEKPFSKILLKQLLWTVMWETGVTLPEQLFIRELLELCWTGVLLVGIMLPCPAHWTALSPPTKHHLCTSFALQEQHLLFLDKCAASGDN